MLPEDKLREEVKLLTKAMNAKELEKAIKYLQSIVGQTTEETLTNPMHDDEERTEEDNTAIAQGKGDIKAGRIHSLDEIKRHGDLVVMSMETYERKLAQADLYQKLAEAESQIKNGEPLLDAEYVFEKLRGKYGKE